LRAATYCFDCGRPLQPRLAGGASLHCPGCGYEHRENTKILVSCLASWGDKVLWMRRANEPYRGLWSVPCGFMELGETLAEAAARELFEETGARLAPQSLALYVVGSLTWMNQVYVVFRGELASPDCCVGEEALAVGLFSESEAPWSNFAFPQSEAPTRRFYRELASGHFGVYLGEYTSQFNTTWLLRSDRD
jgi:ADP-ribose pyrophosphatase YjhB (NUDIX family)